MTPERARKVREVTERRFPTLVVVFEEVDDPHNLGAMLRTCDAVGAGEIRLVYPFKGPRMHELKTRSAASATKWLNIKRDASISSCVSSLHRRGFTVLVTALDARGKAQWDFDLTGKTALIIGNEHRGASETALRLADGVITIPMRGMVQSLNVSVATAVVLEEALRQRLTVKSRPKKKGA